VRAGLRLAYRGERKSMTTDDTALPLPRHDEQLQDTVPGQPRGCSGPGRHRGPGRTTIVAERFPRWFGIGASLLAGLVVALIPWDKFPGQGRAPPGTRYCGLLGPRDVRDGSGLFPRLAYGTGDGPARCHGP
jgi:hypothetical protein